MGKVGKVGDRVRFCEIGYWEEWSVFFDVAMSHNTSVFSVEIFCSNIACGEVFHRSLYFLFFIVYSARGSIFLLSWTGE